MTRSNITALPFQPGDECWPYSRDQLMRMDLRFSRRLRRAFASGEESRAAAEASRSGTAHVPGREGSLAGMVHSPGRAEPGALGIQRAPGRRAPPASKEAR